MNAVRTAKLTPAQHALATDLGFEVPTTRSIVVTDKPLKALATAAKDAGPKSTAFLLLGKIGAALALAGDSTNLEPDPEPVPAGDLPTVEGATVTPIEVPEGTTATATRPIAFRSSTSARTARFGSTEKALAWITKAFAGADPEMEWADVMDPATGTGFRVTKVA